MHLTVRQLLENHTRGMSYEELERQGMYLDEEVPTIHDLTDLQELKRANNEKLQKAISEAETAKKKKDEQDPTPPEEKPAEGPKKPTEQKKEEPEPTKKETETD